MSLLFASAAIFCGFATALNIWVAIQPTAAMPVLNFSLAGACAVCVIVNLVNLAATYR